MAKNLQQLAAIIAQETGLEAKVSGNGEFEVQNIATINNATNSDITFLANPKYKKHLDTCSAGAVILGAKEQSAWSGNCIVMDNPYAGFAIVAQVLDTTPQLAAEIHPSASVHPEVKLGKRVRIAANVTVEKAAELGDEVQIGAGSYVGQGTIIGSGSRIWPNVTVYHGVTLGENTVIHSQSVIGADGFGYAPLNKDGDQHWLKIPQLGGVVVGDNTEIGASTTIDRGAIENTKIGQGVIIDNQIQIGHNVEIGDYTAIAAATNIAGSTKIGRNVTIGGCCAIAGHLNICDRAFITGRTFVMKDINEPNVYSSGMPAATNKEWRNNTARYRKLTELFDRVKKIEKALDDN